MPIINEIIKQTVVLQFNTNGGRCNYYNSENGCLYCNPRESVPYNNNNNEMNNLQTSKLLDFSNNSFYLVIGN